MQQTRRGYRLSATLLVALLAAFQSPIYAQNAPVTVRATFLDSLTGQPLGDGTVELRGVNVNRSERVDPKGIAVFQRVSAGSYTLSTIRVGYRPRQQQLVIGNRDTTIVISMFAIPAQLAERDVRASTQEVFGIIGGMPNLTAIVGARVALGGSHKETTTDSLGKYSINDVKPGQYSLRVTAPGFVDILVLVNLQRGKALESSHLLDVMTGKRAYNGVALHDMETRLEFKSFNSAIVSGDELRRHGDTFTTALQQSREVAMKGLMVAGPICVFLNGRPMPGRNINSFDTNGVTFVEVYGERGDPTNSLASRFPKGGECAAVLTLAGARATNASVKYIGIWMKEP
ncbi:MAG: carboxypeptidase-like regulatory domain-containing protein [Gemmatimonadaceae bacterium]